MAASPRASARRCWRTRFTTEAGQLADRLVHGLHHAARRRPAVVQAVAHRRTLCPSNPLGVKGCGEAGRDRLAAAVINAITDAIGNNKLDMPATPDRVWHAIHGNA